MDEWKRQLNEYYISLEGKEFKAILNKVIPNCDQEEIKTFKVTEYQQLIDAFVITADEYTAYLTPEQLLHMMI